MDENSVARVVIDTAYRIHRDLGPGLLEAVYIKLLYHCLAKRGLRVVREVYIPIEYDGIRFDEGFRADLVVEDLIIVEVKCVSLLHPVHKRQLLTYLRLTGKRLGLLVNFNETLIKNGINRVVNGMPG